MKTNPTFPSLIFDSFNMPNFSVDTHLFRELGELLVGRDSTALVELIKNAYDADATHVTVYGAGLDDISSGRIIISDNGIGMGPDQFKNGFLRVASRLKSEGTTTSAKYGRRFTGAKGIGRLAAHKLSKLISISSVPDSRFVRNARSIQAEIDWDIVESVQTLDDVEGSNAIQLVDEPLVGNQTSGTSISLTRLRRRWTPGERERFFAEVTSFTPPRALLDPVPGVVQATQLFSRPLVQDAKESDPGFRVDLQGDFEVGDDYWQSLARTASFVLEIDAKPNSDVPGKPTGTVRYSIAPTMRFLAEYPDAQQQIYETEHLDAAHGPFFQARILIREGGTKSTDNISKTWLGRSAGIRIFMEGFRVLPYGEPGNDWLQIDYRYAKREKYYYSLDEIFSDTSGDKQEGLVALQSTSYFGAIFLTANGSPHLRMLINREGFIPEASFDLLVSMVKNGVDLLTRVRAKFKKETRNERREERQSNIANIEVRPAVKERIEIAVQRAKDFATQARENAAEGDYQAASRSIELAATEFAQASELSDLLITEAALLRILASVGTQMAAFVHEINALLGTATALENAFQGMITDFSLPAEPRRRIGLLQSSVSDLRRSIERQASYLVDVVSPDARRRRSRQKLSERFEAGRRLVEPLAARRNIEIINEISSELRSPPMFPAELAVLFSNLLTNAVKAAGPSGRILASATQNSSSLRLKIENTGVEVKPSEGEKWFEPFESTTVDVDPVLGQGMGMGLPITRNILSDYGAEIHFVDASPGYTTAIEIAFEE